MRLGGGEIISREPDYKPGLPAPFHSPKLSSPIFIVYDVTLTKHVRRFKARAFTCHYVKVDLLPDSGEVHATAEALQHGVRAVDHRVRHGVRDKVDRLEAVMQLVLPELDS